MAGAGAAAAPCRAGRAAGAACFAPLVGLRLNKLYLFKKEKQQEKKRRFGVKKGFVSVPVLRHHRERLSWAGELGLRRGAGWQGEGSSGGLTHLPFPREQEAAQGMPLKELLLLP